MREADKVVDETTGAWVDAEPLNAEEQEIIDSLQRSRAQPLTKQERWLSLEQARALGEIDVRPA